MSVSSFFSLREFSPEAKKILLILACIPAFLLCWLGVIVLKPVYYSALGTFSPGLYHVTNPKAKVMSVDDLTPQLPAETVQQPSMDDLFSNHFSNNHSGDKQKQISRPPNSIPAKSRQVKKVVKEQKSVQQKVNARAANQKVAIASDYSDTISDLPPVCGGAPPEFLPFPVDLSKCQNSAIDLTNSQTSENGERDVETARRKLSRTVGFTMTGTGCNKAHTSKVIHENDGAGPDIKKNVKAYEKPLVDCLQDISKCDCAAKDAANQLSSIRTIQKKLRGMGRIKGMQTKYKSCAVVGNAGHLSLKKYGKYIDRHDFIVRFNVQPVQPYAEHVGNKTSLRMANHRRSLALCCRGNFPEGKLGINGTGVMIWFPASQDEIAKNCKNRFPNNPVMSLSLKQSLTQADSMRSLRKDLSRLGMGPFGQWRQLTSGGHAVFLLLNFCESISMYGITTYSRANSGGADHYGAALNAGKTKESATTRARSGQKWHDWKGEKTSWRLLHAAGKLSICSL